MARRRPPWPYSQIPERTPYYVRKPGEPDPAARLFFDPRLVPPVPKSLWGRFLHRLLWG